MTDLRARFHTEFEDDPVPDLWDRIEDLAATPSPAPRLRLSRIGIAVAAAVLTALVIGGPLVLLRSDGPAAPVPEFPPAAQAPAFELVDLPPTSAVVDMVELPAGGYAAITREGALWSSDGRAWYDIDPQRRVTAMRPTEDPWDRRIVGAGDRIVVLDDALPGVWIGDPLTGTWGPVLLDLDRFPDGSLVQPLTLVGNDIDALVVVRAIDEGGDGEPGELHGFWAWIVDPSTASTSLYPLPMPDDADYVADLTAGSYALGQWFDGRWFIAVTSGGRGSLLVSADGASWSEATWPFSEPPDYWGSLMSLTAGRSGIVALVCYWGGDSFWYSADGVDWAQTRDGRGHESAYVENLGYVVLYEVTAMVSEDGRTWREPAQLGIAIERYRGESDPPPGLFVFGKQLWQWSADQ